MSSLAPVPGNPAVCRTVRAGTIPALLGFHSGVAGSCRQAICLFTIPSASLRLNRTRDFTP